MTEKSDHNTYRRIQGKFLDSNLEYLKELEKEIKQALKRSKNRLFKFESNGLLIADFIREERVIISTSYNGKRKIVLPKEIATHFITEDEGYTPFKTLCGVKHYTESIKNIRIANNDNINCTTCKGWLLEKVQINKQYLQNIRGSAPKLLKKYGENNVG